ncbi:hypothetical protein LNP17_15885 [Klebsiella variicola subsp. variicola]|nr:hypothetical protein [Klebsiella variicola subsp. variicola]
MLGNVLNPKMGVFYVSFLPQFIPRRAFTRQLDLSPGHHPCIDWDAVVINADYRHSLCRRHPEKPAVVKWMDRTTGCLFLLFAAKLAMSRR